MQKRLLLTLAITAISANALFAGSVDFSVKDAAGNSLCLDFNSEIKANEDGTYTITYFFNSGSPVSFAIGSETTSSGAYYITAAGNALNVGDYSYLQDSDDAFLSVSAKLADGSTRNVNYVRLREAGESNATPDGSSYDCVICIFGVYDDYSNAPDHFIHFRLDPASLAAIQSPEVDLTDAPKEYFDLQGRPVANPAAGSIYILRQGSKTSKVILK